MSLRPDELAALQSMGFNVGGQPTGNFGSFAGESPDARYERILGQLTSGQRDFESVRRGLGDTAGSTAGALANDRAILASGDPGAIRARLDAIFGNRGVPTTASAPDKPQQQDRSGEQSARAIITATLSEYGLESLAEWAWGLYLSGAPVEQIMLEMRQRPEYGERFSGMQALRQKGRAISERDYISLERTYTQLFRASGLPLEVFGTRQFLGRLIGGEVSPAEAADRVALLEADIGRLMAVPEMNAELEAFERFYGVRPTFGDLAALALNADEALPALQRKFTAVRNERAAGRAGFGDLSREEAESLADLGISEQQAGEGFGALTASRELFGVLPGMETSEDTIGRGEQLQAAFAGNSFARERIERRRRQRQAAFEGGGGFAGTNEGFSGIGSAR